MCVGLMEGCLRHEGRGTVVHYGTRRPCLCSSLEKAENGDGTVVPRSTGTPCQSSGWRVSGFARFVGLCVCFVFLGFGVLRCAWMQFDHLITLALIPNDVYKSPK